MTNKVLMFTRSGFTGHYMSRNHDDEVIRENGDDAVDIIFDDTDDVAVSEPNYKHVATEAPVEFGILDYLDAVLSGWQRE